MYDFELKISNPTESVVAQRTSAATPAFHPKPIDDKSAEKK